MELTERKEKAPTEQTERAFTEQKRAAQPEDKERERGSQSHGDEAQMKCSQSRRNRAQLKGITEAKTPNAR